MPERFCPWPIWKRPGLCPWTMVWDVIWTVRDCSTRLLSWVLRPPKFPVILIPFPSVYPRDLGAPVGSVLCGSRELVKKARRWRKVLGGGMRQAGILAAAGILALQNHVDRLAEDHANAQILGEGLSRIDEIEIDMAQVQTNMVFASLRTGSPDALAAYLKDAGVLIEIGNPIRLVTHMDVNTEDIHRAISLFEAY